MASLLLGVIAGLLLSLLVVEYERGTVEGLFRRLPDKSGTPLNDLRCKFLQYESVWFVGHSLGGALALLGFALYRAWCHEQPGCRDNAYVITFGAPRVGDQEFVNAFESKHSGRYCNVVRAGDPVPETPPCSWRSMLKRGVWRRGAGGFWLTALSVLWKPYASLWGQDYAGEWHPGPLRLILGEKKEPFHGAAHSMEESYLLLLEKTQDDDKATQPNSPLHPSAARVRS